MSQLNELIKIITTSGKKTSRSQQQTVGPSEVGGCPRRLWYKLHNQEVTNENTLSLASILGTSIHSHIQKIFYEQDPFAERFLLEQEFESPEDDLIGHVDMYDKINEEIIDWKTSTKSNLGRYFPSKPQRWQVQLYGYLVNRGGYPVKTVTLVGIPRDGDERDIVYHSEPFSPDVCKEALTWLSQVRGSEFPPPAEKDPVFCKNYCGFYDPTGVKGCVGRPKAEAVNAIIEDQQIALAAKHYLQINEQLDNLEKEKDVIKSLFEGINGVTSDGIKINWSITSGRKSVDEEEVHKLLGHIPYKIGKESTRLTVKQ